MAVIDPGAQRGASPLGNLPVDLNLKKPADADKYLTMDNIIAIARAMGYDDKAIAQIKAKSGGKVSTFISNMGAGSDMTRINVLAHDRYEDTPQTLTGEEPLFAGMTHGESRALAGLLNARKKNPVVWNYLKGLVARNYKPDTLRQIIGKSRADDEIDNIVAASQESGVNSVQADEVLGSLSLGTTTKDVAARRAKGPGGAIAGAKPGMTPYSGQGALAGGLAGIAAGTAPPEQDRQALPGDRVGTGGGLDTGQPGITGTPVEEVTPFGEPVPTDPKEVDAYIRRNFGYWAFLLDDPELGPKFRELATGKANKGMIQAAVLNSTWYKTHTAAQQTWAALASTNPAQANAQLQGRAKDIGDVVRRYGMTLDPARMSKLAEDSLKYGWNDQQLMAAIANEGVFAEGKSNPIKANLQKTASDYVLNFSSQAIDTWTKQIIAGEATEEEFKLYAQEQALSMYPSLAAAITAGRTVKQYADQYVQKAADVLELPPDKINLQESKWQKALQHRNPKTGEIQSMTLAEWENYLKTDPSYNYNKTKGARQEARKLATTIATTFGAA